MTMLKLRIWKEITEEIVKTALKKSHKWTSPGIDKLPNFWLNTLPGTHMDLAVQNRVKATNSVATPVVTLVLES